MFFKNYLNKFLIILFGLTTQVACAGDNVDERIAQARSAGPDSISANATIIDGGKVLVEGTNGWTCMPDTFPGDNAPMCNDGVWMEMLGAFGQKAEFKPETIGISYMLMGEPQGSGVSNSDPFHADHKHAHDYVQSGPHLMIVVPKEQLAGIPDNPQTGGPFVMWRDTPYAHIMVPIAPPAD
jgi:hypothetical protein